MKCSTSNRRVTDAAQYLAIVCTVCVLLGSCATQRVTPERRVALTGAVVDDRGQPVAGALIRVGLRRAESDSGGRFRIDSIAPGTHRVVVTCAGYEPLFHTLNVASRSDYARFRVVGVAGLIDQAITLLSVNADEDARAIGIRAARLAPDDERVELLETVLETTLETALETPP